MKENEKRKQNAIEEENNARVPHNDNAVPGINTPGIELPAFNPPVPNRAWTALKNGLDIEELSPEERNSLTLGRN